MLTPRETYYDPQTKRFETPRANQDPPPPPPLQTILRFSKDYNKLQYPLFCTIRRRNKFSINLKVQCFSPSWEIEALIVDIQTIRFGEISPTQLYFDTAPFAKTYQEAVKILNSFYERPISRTEMVYVIYLVTISRKKKPRPLWAIRKERKDRPWVKPKPQVAFPHHY